MLASRAPFKVLASRAPFNPLRCWPAEHQARVLGRAQKHKHNSPQHAVTAFEKKAQRQLAIPNFAKTMTDVAMAHELNETVLAQQDMEDAVESSRCASQALAPGVPAIFVAQCIPRGVVTGHPGPSPCRTLRGGITRSRRHTLA